MDGMRDKRTLLGMVTLFRMLPWALMDDKRPLDILVRTALDDAKRYTGREYEPDAVLRGTIQVWLGCLGQNVNPDAIETIVQEVKRQVDESIQEQYDDGLEGKRVLP